MIFWQNKPPLMKFIVAYYFDECRFTKENSCCIASEFLNPHRARGWELLKR
jgi:hypothetical protein